MNKELTDRWMPCFSESQAKKVFGWVMQNLDPYTAGISQITYSTDYDTPSWVVFWCGYVNDYTMPYFDED